jgi:hypothetical protein
MWLGEVMIDLDDVTRVEVIDNNGRTYTKNNVERVWLSLQDDNRTLKVMVTFEDEEEIYID